MCTKHYVIMNIWSFPIFEKEKTENKTHKPKALTSECKQTVSSFIHKVTKGHISKENSVKFNAASRGRTCLRHALPKNLTINENDIELA